MPTPIDLEKLRSLSIGRRSRDKVREWRTDDGERHRAVTDELGNTVTQHAKPNNTEDRQDVHIKAPCVSASISVEEKRD